MTNDEIAQLWNDGLRHVSPEGFADADAAPKTRQFLTAVGLPDEAPLEVTFEPTLAPIVVGGTTYLKVGDDYGTQLGVAERDESLWSVDPEGNLPARLINSSVRDFVVFLGIYVDAQPALQDATDEEAEELVDALRARFGRLDPKAVDDPETWWSVILEQTVDGLV